MHDDVFRPRAYVAVFAALVGLTVLTVAVSFQELGPWHVATGLGIATVKSLLVVLFFMHLVRSSRLTWLVVMAGIYWLHILVALTFADYFTRGWMAY